MAQIHDALIEISRKIEPIAKGKTNAQQGYKYRGIDQVAEMLQPLLAEHGVLTLPRVVEKAYSEHGTKSGGRMCDAVLTIDWHFVAADGSEVVVTTVGEGSDSADKASNKAMTASQKYALTLAFTIPWSDQTDGDADHPDRGARQNGSGAKVEPVRRPAPAPPASDRFQAERARRQEARQSDPPTKGPGVDEAQARQLLAYAREQSEAVGIHGLELANRAFQWLGIEPLRIGSKAPDYMHRLISEVSSDREYAEAIDAVVAELTQPQNPDAKPVF